jgi:hypothetical protein
MRILFDQNVPLPIRPYLKGHVVLTTFQLGWATLRNGELPNAAERTAFDVFLTAYKNIQYQQNLSARKIAIVVVSQQQWPIVQLPVGRKVLLARSAPMQTRALCWWRALPGVFAPGSVHVIT